MDYVPFIEQNKNVVSPKFIPIILESCSLIESVFRYMAGDNERRNLRAYSQLYEHRLRLEEATTMFLAPRLQLLRPFLGWNAKQPAWWEIYNRIKHDRITNYALASFTHAVNALAGLHQVLARSVIFVEQLTKAGWINESDEHFAELLTMRDAGVGNPPEMPAHSKLFVSPLTGDFVDWTTDPPAIEQWAFTERVMNYIWDYEHN